jgi:hypothetical protein
MKLRACFLGAVLAVASLLSPVVSGLSRIEQELGTIDFPTSGNAAAQPLFIKGVLLMHSFNTKTRRGVRGGAEGRPGFAMALGGR